jgi:hypothetical protein
VFLISCSSSHERVLGSETVLLPKRAISCEAWAAFYRQMERVPSHRRTRESLIHHA